jgi:thiol-disulfide isomerase/thioredoxin
MKSGIAQSLSNSHSYSEYRNRVSSLIKEDKSSGNEQSEDLLHYSQLNDVRMNRLEKTIKISEQTIQQLQSLKKEYIWLVISEGWCGDAAQILPVIYKMAEFSPKIELKIVFRDEDEDLMKMFLTNGGKAIPKLLVIDIKTLEVLGHFGPRPQGAKQLMLDYKEKFGIVDETVKAELQLWYLHDKGITTQNEIMEVMQELE